MGHLGMGLLSLKHGALLLLVVICTACASAAEPNLLQTAIAETLEALPTPTATARPSATAEPGAPPPGKIVFACQFSKRLRRNQICLINADGTDLRILTQGGPHDDYFPSLSPDGQSVVFASDRFGSKQIFELELATSELTQITELVNMEAHAPEISPDGARIVFYGEDYRRCDLGCQIWVINRDGSNPRALTNLTGGGWDPVWSPDGEQIQFASTVNGRPQLFHMNADGSRLRQVTDLVGIRGRNDWSPDGQTLATYIGSTWDWDIYTFDLDGENLTQITDGLNNLAPSFSPDGQWITFMSYRDHPLQDLGCEIYVMRADGSDVRRLTDNDICDWQPRWGP